MMGERRPGYKHYMYRKRKRKEKRMKKEKKERKRKPDPQDWVGKRERDLPVERSFGPSQCWNIYI